jgi:nucleotide-binding universal stress UspA family protein
VSNRCAQGLPFASIVFASGPSALASAAAIRSDGVMNNRVVVGYDGSSSSVAATEWAAAEAAARGAELVVLTCRAGDPGCASHDRAEHMAAQLRERHPELSCHGAAAHGAPRDALVEASRDADLLVVGKTGSGTARALILGSVANAVLRKSTCPTAVIPGSYASRPRAERIVVGVDGSSAARHALDWAVDAATVRGGELTLVHAWSYTYTGPVAQSVAERDRACADAARFLDPLVDSTKTVARGFTVVGRLVEDSAAAALLDHSASADLLVVGSTGRGGARSILVGSVARAVTEHATCPTAVVPDSPHR